MECMSVFSRRGLGSQLPEYDPQLQDFYSLGIKNISIHKDRWLFDFGYPALAIDDVEANFDEILQNYQPDLVWSTGFTCLPLLQRAKEADCAALWYIQDCRPTQEDLQRARELDIGIITCSDFIAERVKHLSGSESTTVYPLIESADYYVTDNSKQYVTFINPRPVKGYDIFLKIAAHLPEIEFMVVEAWPLGEHFEEVKAQLEYFPNVRFVPQLIDIRTVLKQTKLLLVPSIVQEAAARVIREAQLNSIPVIASKRGGNAEIVGEGGLIVEDYLNDLAWASAIKFLLEDEKQMKTLATRAAENAEQRKFSADGIMEKFVSACKRAVARNTEYEL